MVSKLEKQNNLYLSTFRILLAKNINEMTESDLRFAENQFQAYLINYINGKICERINFDEDNIEVDLCRSLGDTLWNSIFTELRQKFSQKPGLVFSLIKGVINISDRVDLSLKARETRMLAMLRSAIPEISAETFLKKIIESRSVMRTILFYQFQHWIKSSEIRNKFLNYYDNDEKRITEIIYKRYVKKRKFDRLAMLVNSGELKLEKKFLDEIRTK